MALKASKLLTKSVCKKCFANVFARRSGHYVAHTKKQEEKKAELGRKRELGKLKVQEVLREFKRRKEEQEEKGKDA